MADKEEAEQATPRGNEREWEVVSLTASAYDAAPGPKHDELNDNEKGNTEGESKPETSNALFLSGHFVFPPSQHENLPLEPDNIMAQNTEKVEDDVPESGAGEGMAVNKKDEENFNIKDFTEPEEFTGIQFFDDKGNRLSIRGPEFEEGSTLEGLNLAGKEQSIDDAAKLSSLHSDTTLNRSSSYDETTMNSEITEPSDQVSDSDILHMSKELKKDDKYDKSELPCGAWWKRRATSLYTHAKDANAFWSVFVAAAVMGLVILGQQWQQERWQVLQLKWHLNINDEKLGKMFAPISRFKDVIVGGSRRGSFIRGSSSTDH